MRPTRLELRGFTAFREPVTVEFGDAELFALAGPTGSGKSSLIDAMCFALYGSVPRLGQRAVAPIISSGRNEARIRLDFSVGERGFTAARVVRRTASGATTKEARLEAGGVVVAGDAAGVTAAVEQLLGLGFDQFTKCVVLPQGEFARFLHDTPADRQALLVRLLEMAVYARMRSEANTRATAAATTRDLTAQQLAGLVDATPASLAAAGRRVDQLMTLRDELDAAQPRLDELATVRRQAQAEAAAAADRAERLSGIAVAGDVADAAARTAADTAAAEAVVSAEQRLSQAEQATADAEQARSALPPEATLLTQQREHAEQSTLVERIAGGQPVVAARRLAEQAGEQRLGEAAAEVAQAEQALAAVRLEHAAHALAATLVAGKPCPVCRQPVHSPPGLHAPAALTVAEQSLQAASAGRRAAEAALAGLREQRARAEQVLESLREARGAVEARLAGAPPPEEVQRLLGEAARADRALSDARAEERAARAAVRDAGDAAAAVQRRRKQAWARFDAARDAVAALGPPPADREDLPGSWSALAGWARGEQEAQRNAAAAAQAAAEAARRESDTVVRRLDERCHDCAVPVAVGTRLRDAVGDALGTAAAQRQRIASDLATAQRLKGELEASAERATVARALAQHLAAPRFEQWLLDEALQGLAEEASGTLHELSAGQYSLAVDAQRNFAVIDHRNADELRSARTLSGGETFLASLALALALAERLAELSTGSEPRLESMFLDEGFGTLDPDTLDVVAAAIEELGAGGRTVGIVTHVRDLAERVPVRFEVRKGPGGSTVERIER